MSQADSPVFSLELDELKLQVFPNVGESMVGSASRRQDFTPRSPCKSHVYGNVSQRTKESARLRCYVSPKENDSTLDEAPDEDDEEDESTQEEKASFSKWKKLSLIINSVYCLQNTEVVTIKSIGDLKTSLYDSTNSPGLSSHYIRGDIMYITAGELSKQAMRDARDEAHFFRAIDRGNVYDFNYVKDRLEKDPKKFIYSNDDKARLTNKQDSRGYTPLYAACKNGNIKMVKLFLSYQANPYQYSEVSKKEKESILSVSARWGHVDLIELLTGQDFVWSKKELNEAYKAASNKHIKEILKKKMSTATNSKRSSFVSK